MGITCNRLFSGFLRTRIISRQLSIELLAEIRRIQAFQLLQKKQTVFSD